MAKHITSALISIGVPECRQLFQGRRKVFLSGKAIMNGRGILLLRMRKLINGSLILLKIDNYTKNYTDTTLKP